MQKDQIKILIVDDDKNFLRMMESSISSRGHFVKTATDEASALSILMTQPFHICLIDCILKTGQGVNLVHKIREYLGNSLEIILLSGVFSRSSVSGYFNQGISDFLRKPISETNLEEIINKTKKNLLFNEKNNNQLIKSFSNAKSTLDKLKGLIRINQMSSVEFFIALSTLLFSEEKSSMTFSTNDQDEYTLFINKGAINNCIKVDEVASLSEYLIANKFSSADSIKKFANKKDQDITSIFVNCFVSPYNLFEFKQRSLSQALQAVSMAKNISIKIKMFNREHEENYLNFNEKDLGDYIYKNSNENLKSLVLTMFNKDIMDYYVQFDEDKDEDKYSGSLAILVKELKTGVQIKLFLQKNPLAIMELFSILCQGGAFLVSNDSQARYYYMYERFNKLKSFLNKTDSSKVFQVLGNLSKENLKNHNLIKECYRRFMKFNHIDILGKDLSKDLTDIISETNMKMKFQLDAIVDAEFIEVVRKKEKKLIMEESIKIAEQKKASLSFLEVGKFQEAFSIIRKISLTSLEESLDWQMHYVWIASADSKIKYDEDLHKKFMQNLNKNFDKLKKNHLYYYILGLRNKKIGNYQKAMQYFNFTKTMDPTFTPVYNDFKKYAFLENKKIEESSFLGKFKQRFLKKAKKAS